MCLSVPARIVSVEGEYAEVSVNGALFRAGLQMIENPQVGEYVLLHAGFAIQKIKEEEAREIRSLLDEIRASDPTGNVL
jgi:hydrogenase expression/formation protein HypC